MDRSSIAQLEGVRSFYRFSSFPLSKPFGWSDLLTMIRVEKALSKNWTAVIYFAAPPSLS
jgi:hypothetical protein